MRQASWLIVMPCERILLVSANCLQEPSMKPALLIGSTLRLAATVLVAQSPAPSAQQSAIAVTPSGESCPVSMHALQGRGSGLIAVKNQAPPNGISQRIHLILGDRRTAKIVSARVAVRGYSGKARMAQASS